MTRLLSVTVLVALTAAVAIAAMARAADPADAAVYLNTKSGAVLWISKDGDVRLGDVISPAKTQCPEDMPLRCFQFFSINLAVPQNLQQSRQPWHVAGICFSLLSRDVTRGVYQIQMREAPSCQKQDDKANGALLVFTEAEGVVYFEDLHAPEVRSSWIKVSGQGLLVH